MLGILPIEQGFISISGLIPGRAIEEWPGAISYVPQDVMISNGTIRSNVSMGFSPDEFNDDLIWQALRLASLEDFVASLPDGLNQIVGDRGSQLSGGQRQRLGIARAMFTKPKLIVLDEATSSLDSQTELDFSDSINAIKGEVTIVIVAHRLSTIRECDNVIYMKQGEIRANGSFDHVRNSVPEFNEQAKLMGL
jgi:ABC-type multidrug transport system fused ATPase/permease subunit